MATIENKKNMMSRQADIIPTPWEHGVTIIGCGGIGSNAADLLASMGIEQFVLIDNDKVGEENVYPGRFSIEDIGRPKVEALQEHLSYAYDVDDVTAYANLYEDIPPDVIERAMRETTICILSTDSLASRARAFDELRDKYEGFFIDARMGGMTATVYCLDTVASAACYRHHNERLNDLPDTDLPCGMKATAPLTKGALMMMIGHVVAKILRDETPPYMQTYDLFSGQLLVVQTAPI